MATGWETVHVFVSSTFNDMHAERDYLVKEVFPRLAEWCEKRKLRLVDVDLRWGVTETDATRNRGVVETCLRRIDDCRPFFICLLGQRYGWVPRPDDVPPETLSAFPNLGAYLARSASVTELEILHAITAPFQGSERDGTLGPVEHALFYVRDPSYLGSLPREPALVRRSYTDEAEADPGVRRFLCTRQGHLRDQIVALSDRTVRTYSVRWSDDARHTTPELALPLRCPAALPENQSRWRRQWRDEAGVEVAGLDVADDPEQLATARAFNERVTAGRLVDFACEGESLGDVILTDLKLAIASRYPDHQPTEAAETGLQRELDQQESFIAAATEGFVAREGDFAELDRYLDGDSQQLFVLTAPGGMGKSTLLAEWIRRARSRVLGPDSIHFRFVGASDGSTTVHALLSSLLTELKEVARKIESEIPTDPMKLRDALGALLAEAGLHGHTVIVIDALNQLDSGLSDLGWLPAALPPGIKIVVSFKRDEGDEGATRALAALREHAHTSEVRPFAESDRLLVVRSYLARYLKELDESLMRALVAVPGAENPLYLRVVLSELRVFGSFANLAAKLARDFGTTPVSAFHGVLARLESDPAYSALEPSVAVPLVFGFLAHARGGLPVDALVLLIEEALGNGAPSRDALRAAVHLYLRQVRPFLARREGRHDFFYESFLLAARERYTAATTGKAYAGPVWSAEEWQGRLGALCDRWERFEEGAVQAYALANRVTHHLQAGQGEVAASALMDFGYLARRIELAGSGATVGLSTELASAAPHARDSTFSEWKAFVETEAHRIEAVPDVGFLQAAVAVAEGSSVTQAAERWVAAHPPGRAWLRQVNRSRAMMKSACMRTFDGHVDEVWAVALHTDGRRMVSGSRDRTLKVWDLETGACLRTLALHFDPVTAVALHPNGRRAVSASEDRRRESSGRLRDGTLLVWDLDSGASVRTLVGHAHWADAVAVVPDGRRAVSAGRDSTLRVWDLDTGACLRTLEGHTLRVSALAVDAKPRAVSASWDKTLRVWDLDTGACVQTLVGHAGEVLAVALHPDGRRALSGSNDRTLRVWDLDTGACLLIGERQAGSVSEVAIHADGRLAVTATEGMLRTWDVETGSCLRSLGESGRAANALALHPDGRRAVTAHGDATLRMWDLGTRPGGSSLPARVHPVSAVFVGPSGRHAVSAHSYGFEPGTLRVWDIETGTQLRTLEGHTRGVNDLAPCPDDRHVISASDDGSLRVWSLATGACVRTLRLNSVLDTRPTCWRWVASCPDGRHAVSASDGTLCVWDLATGDCVRTLHVHERAVSAALYPDGRRALTANDRGTLQVWDLETGACVRTFDNHARHGKVMLVFADGRRGLLGGIWETATMLRVWDLDADACLRTFRHAASVTAAALSPDGRRALSASSDKMLRVWDLDTERELARWRCDASIEACAASQDRIVLGDTDGEVAFLELVEPANAPT